MSRLRRYLTGRVARKVFLLFVLSAFAPLSLIAALSYFQFRQLHLQYGEQRLAVASKDYAMAVFGRLQLAAESAGSAAEVLERLGRSDDPAVARFRALARVDAAGRQTNLRGAIELPSIPENVRLRIAQRKGSLVILPRADGPERIVLLVPAATGGPRAALAAELHPAYLWGAADMLPAATDMCVFAQGSASALHCSGPVFDPDRQHVDGARPPAAFHPFAWMREGATQRAVAWPQFMGAEFGIGDWLFVASQPESHQLGRIPELQKLYIPIVVLTLLAVALLSLRQSRNILVPIEQLALGARRIARNDFSAPVTLRRADEFGELAGAFNAMSKRLGRQIATLTALAEIDRLILSMLDTEQVVRTVMERAAQALFSDCACIILLDHDNPDLARTYLYAPGQAAGAPMLRQLLAPGERGELQGASAARWIALAQAAPARLAPLRERGMHSAYVQPIVWRGALCGVLALAYRTAPAIDGEDLAQIRDFADRVAVAMSSAWRDEQLHAQAHHDVLTGLPNRLLLKDRLNLEIAKCQREGGSFALLFIDLDHFKNVNDSQGHEAGDRVLKQAAERISSIVRASDTVSRLGGDEFTVLLSGIARAQDAAAVGEHIVESLSEPFALGEAGASPGASAGIAYLSASVGIAVFPQDGTSAEILIRNADTAMYRAKAAGRAQVVYFEERMNAAAVERVTLDRALRRAEENGELQLHYQPQIALGARHGGLHGAEALLRWTHPELGAVAPARFIPIAEEFGQIERIGAWALREGCRQLSAWRAAGLTPGRLAINVSARQFRKDGLASLVRQCTEEAGIAPQLLELEITEGVLVDPRGNAERVLRELAEMGVTIALDDFGTGFSSMAYLRRFPVHAIKIDRAFVKGLGRDRDSLPIIASIIAMAHALGMTVTAEGVESAEQLAILRQLHCDQAQGFQFSPALPATEFAAYAASVSIRNDPVRLRM